MSDILEILYQDDYLLAVNKPAGHLVHPSRDPQSDDLVAMKIVRDQIGRRVYTIHRIDRPTSGVLLLGLDRAVARQLHAALEAHAFEKKYLAVVLGATSNQSWESHKPIQKEDGAPYREAHTSFKVLMEQISLKLQSLMGSEIELESCRLSLIEAIPHTGRFHQIRRHLLSCGLPIVGDYRYAGIKRSELLCNTFGLSSRMMLQAKSLKIEHPVTKEMLFIEAPVDPLFAKCFA